MSRRTRIFDTEAKVHEALGVVCFGGGFMGAKPDSAWAPNPRTALALSLFLPGAGQIYNRAYWKAPIVWAALGLPAYLTYREHQSYLYYRQAYQKSLQDPTTF
jgi:hypothetical protein